MAFHAQAACGVQSTRSTESTTKRLYTGTCTLRVPLDQHIHLTPLAHKAIACLIPLALYNVRYFTNGMSRRYLKPSATVDLSRLIAHQITRHSDHNRQCLPHSKTAASSTTLKICPSEPLAHQRRSGPSQPSFSLQDPLLHQLTQTS